MGTLALPVEERGLIDPRYAHRANLGRQAHVLLALQRTCGNAHVQRLVHGASSRQEGERHEGERDPSSPSVMNRIAAARNGGQPLQPEARARMEAALGQASATCGSTQMRARMTCRSPWMPGVHSGQGHLLPRWCFRSQLADRAGRWPTSCFAWRSKGALLLRRGGP